MDFVPANLEHFREPLIVLDASGVVAAVNAAGVGLLGISASDAVGRPAVEFPILAAALESMHRSGCRLADLETSGPFSLAGSRDATGASSGTVEVHRVTGGGPFAVALLFRPRVEPRSSPGRTPTPVAPGQPVPGRKKRVLVTDDDAMVRSIIAAVLRQQGYVVVEAQDGEEALEWCECQPGGFDLVMLDLHMPRLGGIEALERLRVLAPGLKVILLSGSMTETGGESLRGVRYQQKPFQNAELVELVRQTLAE